MPATLAIRFLLGRYHATPWDRSVNEGAAEWPPSPWRLLRALTATWHSRWPDLPAEAFDSLLGALGDPPAYLTPPARPGHTRHYLPDLDHQKGETGHTDLTLDPFLSLRRADATAAEPAELLVRWDADLDAGQRSVLAKLAELLPYLGRAESVCEARMLDEDPVPDETWWRPGAEGARTTRLLAPARPVSRAALEVTTVQVRKMRRTQPPGTVWVSYAAAGEEALRRQPRPAVRPVDAVRLAVIPRAPVKLTHGVLLADAVHAAAARKFPDDLSRHVIGYSGAATDHQHAHWVPLPNPVGPADRVQTLLVYVPHGLTVGEVSRLIGIRHVSGRVGGANGNGRGYEFRDLPAAGSCFRRSARCARLPPSCPASAAVAQPDALPARTALAPQPGDPGRVPGHRRERRIVVPRPVGEHRTAGLSRHQTAGNLGARLPPLPDEGDPRQGTTRARPGPGVSGSRSRPAAAGQLSHFGYGVFVPDAE